MSSQPSSNRLWVEQEFAGVSLGDRRRDARLLEAATAMADQPTASNPQRLDWNELRAFYRTVHGPRATPAILQSGHRARTRARMNAVPGRVLLIHDTTELDFTDHPAVHAELGPIGTGQGVGLLQHNSLAFDPEGQQILGLIDQQLDVRRPRPPDETRQQRALRPHKESRLWLQGIRGVGRAPEGKRWIDVCDRGADYFEAMQESRQLGHDFLIRVRQDRRLRVAAGEETDDEKTDDEETDDEKALTTLHAAMAAMTVSATKTVAVGSKGGRPGRTATVQVGYRSVRLQPPQPHGIRRGLMPLNATLIRVWEAGATEARAEAKAADEQARQAQAALQAAEQAAGGDADPASAARACLREIRDGARAAARVKRQQADAYLDWWLATSSPVASAADALQAVSDYEWRWPVAEEYHKVEKTGLRIEGQRFETARALRAALAILAVVAVRLLQLRYARDAQGDAAAGVVASAEEQEMVAKATRFQGATMTVRQFVDRVARLGGYLGRKGDGPPGWGSLWRGYQRLTDLLLGQQLAQGATEVEPPHDDPD